jgi:hypothetical protein
MKMGDLGFGIWDLGFGGRGGTDIEEIDVLILMRLIE